MLPDSQHFEGQKGVLELRDGTRKNDKHLITHSDLHKPNNKLVSAQLKHFWCQDEPQANLDSQDSPRPELGGSHHLTLCLSTKPTSKWLFVPGLPSGSLEIAKIRTLATLDPHNFVCRPPIMMRFEAKLQPSLRAFFKGMFHATYTQGNRVNSRLFVVGS